jgi:hypothetical protein
MMPSNDREVWRKARRKYMEKHPERVAANRAKQNARLKENGYYREWRLKKHYGMSLEQFNDLFTSQGNACAICKAAQPTKRGWFVDHCHTTGAVRGILCHPCNSGIGGLKDSPDIMLAAIDYVQRSKPTGEQS